MRPSVSAQGSAGGMIHVECIGSGLQNAREVVFLSGVIDLQGDGSHLQTLLQMVKGAAFEELWSFRGCLECGSIGEQGGTVFCLLAETEAPPSSTLSLSPFLLIIWLSSQGVLKVEHPECYFRSCSFPIFSTSAGERALVGYQGGLGGVYGAGLESALPVGAIFDGTDAVHLGPREPVMPGTILQHFLDGDAGHGVLQGVVGRKGGLAVDEGGQEEFCEFE